ncbi:OprD family outer membrane porin [Sulfurimonas sp.]|uniref:OprD family outer membrane porin n=1 Tax=Sulfurimonas sp. TaxID=2022749 RepID=UPI003D142C42
MRSILLYLFVIVYSKALFAEVETRKDSIREAVYSVGKLEEKEVSLSNSFENMFIQGTVSGQVRVAYANYNFKNTDPDVYATAAGGILKYELAQFKGFNAGVAFYASKDIAWLSGKGDRRNTELSSSDGEHTDMGEVYVNYQYENLNLRAGRQILDTPLADSDDIRMIQNTFEAYIATYNLQGFNFTAGNIQAWHGTDAGLDDGWQDIGDKGVNVVGVTYAEGLEFQAWYYNMSDLANAFYIDGGGEFAINDDISIHAMVQYLDENELSHSGYGATIYGALCEVVIQDLGLNVAYNHLDSDTAKESFSGTGGGALFTNMDMMIMDNISVDRDVDAIVAGFVYNHENFSFLYAYGDFSGEKDSLGDKAHVVEQDISLEYNVNDEFLIALIYVLSEDKQSTTKTEYDYDRAQLMVNYNF